MQFTPDELKVLPAFAPLLLRMLEDKERYITSSMLGLFSQGERDQTTNLAKLAVVREMAAEINTAIRQEGAKRESERSTRN